MRNEINWEMVYRMEAAAQRMSSAAESMELSARKIEFLLADGFGGNGLNQP